MKKVLSHPAVGVAVSLFIILAGVLFVIYDLISYGGNGPIVFNLNLFLIKIGPTWSTIGIVSVFLGLLGVILFMIALGNLLIKSRGTKGI